MPIDIKHPVIPPPASRRLRILAFDPSLSTSLDTANLNEITAEIPWEPLSCGPIGEYIEVVDYDPASGVFYHSVDLNNPHLLAQDGLPPSESNPQFHQQMVYAVAMTTIRHFERALGRAAFWADRTFQTSNGKWHDQFVRRLRIYPHALREQNAYYSPAKKAVLFGYFPVEAKDEHNTPGTVVFTCLSHDIVAHEVTHALLDGVHPRFNEATNSDVHGFHEAFADIVALFQHFAYPSVLESQIGKTRGTLDSENLLGQLAQQFGRATGHGAALRDALGDESSGVWQLRKPDPHALDGTSEAHERGAILVAAVFRAFLLIYRSRTADLFRIATQGTGKLPDGDIHPDLTRRLAAEAAKCADRVLQMCIRAIDYCPPVNITFGDFLRAIVTADLDFAPDDKAAFRIVFIQSFREWGIYPSGVTSLGLDSLVWSSGEKLLTDLEIQADPFVMKAHLRNFLMDTLRDWQLESDRYTLWRMLRRVREELWQWLRDGDRYGRAYAKLFGLCIELPPAQSTIVHDFHGIPTLEVHSVRPTLRQTVSGATRTDILMEITQRRRGYFDPVEQAREDAQPPNASPGEPDFWYRAGCTIIIDLSTQDIRRVIRTPGTISDDRELSRIRAFLTGEFGTSGNAFDAGLPGSLQQRSAASREEPYALLHTHEEN